jgi:hypothetical protein
MKKFANNTAVPADRSRAEIENILARFGATAFMYGVQNNRAAILFEFQNRRVRFLLDLPTPAEVAKTPRGRARRASVTTEAHAQETRRRWRSLALSIKAKLVAVEDGISSFEEEFLAHVVLPNGQSVGEWMGPQLEATYTNHTMPPLLAAPK